jgi:hypothetical protein
VFRLWLESIWQPAIAVLPLRLNPLLFWIHRAFILAHGAAGQGRLFAPAVFDFVRCRLQAKSEKIIIATAHFSASFTLPSPESAMGKRPLISAPVWVWSGHNNIKINPVFRRMVRSGEFSTKGKLC